MLTCSSCKESKSVEAFSFRNRATGQRQHKCKVCASAASKAWYKRNKGTHIAKVRRRHPALIASLVDRVREFKARPCQDCLRTFPYYVMQCDHVRGIKQFNIADVTRTGSGSFVGLSRLELELEKCEPVCANCHAIRTHNRRARPRN